jgi:hypothetical protein
MPSTESVKIFEPDPRGGLRAVVGIVSPLMGICNVYTASGYTAQSRGRLDDAALYLDAAVQNLRQVYEVLDRYFAQPQLPADEERQHIDWH